MSELADRLAGKFIVIDGPDGSGKSTQLKLLADALRSDGLEVTETRDPGGTAIGDKIRHILLDNDHTDMAIGCEILLYMASRTQLMHQTIAPAMDQGRCVLCDRWVSSTVAYQVADATATADDMLISSASRTTNTLPLPLVALRPAGLIRKLRITSIPRSCMTRERTEASSW